MSDGYDFNHDGKTDEHDVPIYEDVCGNDQKSGKQTYHGGSGCGALICIALLCYI